MATKNDKQEPAKENINKRFEPNANKPGRQDPSVRADTDMEPDEFIAPNADTDLPIDHQVMNDAVLRGEGHAADIINNLPDEDKKEHNKVKDDQEKKMDAEKK